MGQGLILATPLQVLVSASILANDGKYIQPTLIREVLDAEGDVVKPFEPELKWDITVDPKIAEYDADSITTGQSKVVEPWVVKQAQQAMRLVVSEGTAKDVVEVQALEENFPSAGKTGTAEYCDDTITNKDERCAPGHWPAHAWYFGYAPYNDPEIAVVAFIHNGDEGARLSAPVVGQVIQAYYELKKIDQGE
jgi:penicillin-binding protein 2